MNLRVNNYLHNSKHYAVTPSFGHTTKVLKEVVKSLENEQVSLIFKNNVLLIPEFSRIWDKATAGSFFTTNIKRSLKINDHWFFHHSKAQQLGMAKSIILNKARKDSTEAVIIDLDGVVFNEGHKLQDITNFRKAPVFSFFIRSKLVNRFIKYAQSAHNRVDIPWVKANNFKVFPYVKDFIESMRQNNIKVFGLSGRPDILRPYTIQNLAKYNVKLDDLFIKPKSSEQVIGNYRTFKVSTMQTLSNKYRLLGIIGDNRSDLLPHNTQGFNLANIQDAVQVLLTNPFSKTSDILHP